MINTEEIEQVSNINLLDDEQKNTIDAIIQKFDMLGEKENRLFRPVSAQFSCRPKEILDKFSKYDYICAKGEFGSSSI